MDDYYIHGGSTDIMRIGMGVDGQNENLFAVIKKLQIFSGGWFFEVTGSAGSYSVGGDQFIHITKGQLTSRILCQKCSATTRLYADDCLTTCSQGSYQVTTDTNFDHCETCYENCKTCTGRLGTQCSNCFFGNWMPFDSLNCPGKNPCNIHQYDVGNVCQECMDECASCKDSSSCSACAAGFSYNQATHQCEIQTCGDGIVVAGEQCDDGNQFNGDGCSTDCKIELGWYCDPAGGSCYTICGDNVQASNEKCDDGNNLSGDGCDYKCQVEDGYFCEYTNPANIAPFTDVSYKQTCTQCATDCKVCDSATTCSVCTTGNFLSGGTCVASCSVGFYQDTTTSSCQQCPDLCSECTSSSVCTNCIAGAALLNDECLDTCPDGTYNDIDTFDGLRKCLTCPANCVTCASSTQCYTCDTHFFLDIGGSNLCVECDNSCRTCFGPAATNCVLCPPGLTFQVSSSSCINLVCLSSEYANFAIGECQPCDTTCETCSGTLETNCLTCPVQTALSVSHRCLDCIPPNGLVLNADDSCTDICGDGRRVKLVTQCDDGNLIDGDGCSSKCEVEAGWMCSGGNETRADTCVSYIGPKPSIKVSTKDPTVFEISFDRKVVNTLQDKEFVTQILVSLEGIDVDNSRYAISWDSNLQIFRVKFDLLESVVDSMLTVQFKDPLRITDSFLNPVSPSILNRGYPIYYYIDPETRDTAEGLATFSIVLQSINTATMIPLAISGYLSHYWMFLEFFQMVHNLQLIDVRTPYLANEFFISFRYLKLYWLPNAPEDSDMNYDASGQQGKGKFSDLEIDTFFLRNNGYQLTSWAFLLVLWVFLKVIIKVGLKRSLLKKLVYIVMINLEWSLILRAVIEMYFDFCIYSYLQLSNLSFEKGIEGFSSILAIVATVFTVLFPIFCIRKTLQVKNQYLLEEDIKYDTLYREFRKRHRSTVLFLAVVLFHKVLMAAILVGLQTSPEVQIALLVALQVSMIMILLVVRPYVDGSMNFRAIIQELILFAVIALFYGLLNENTDEHVRNNVGKVIVALLIIALLMHCAFLLKDAYLAIQEYRQNPKGVKKNIFGAARVTPSSNQFQLNSGSDIMSDGLELPARSDNGSAQGYRPVSSEIIKEEDETKDIPKKISIDEESLFKDNEKIKIPPLSMQKVYINSKEIKDESKIIPSDVGSHELKEDDRLMGVSGR